MLYVRMIRISGPVAQLGARFHGMEEVDEFESHQVHQNKPQ